VVNWKVKLIFHIKIALWYEQRPGNASGVLKGNDVPLNLLLTFGFKSKSKLFLKWKTIFMILKQVQNDNIEQKQYRYIRKIQGRFPSSREWQYILYNIDTLDCFVALAMKMQLQKRKELLLSFHFPQKTNPLIQPHIPNPNITLRNIHNIFRKF